jgi:hypothetical protein
VKQKLIQSPATTVGPLSRRTVIKQFVGTSAALAVMAPSSLFNLRPGFA